MNTIVDTITSYIDQHRLLHHGSRVIVGLSGGPDSVFLLHYLAHIQKKYALTLIAAHLNHQWRTEADQEEQFCKNVAATYGITFVSKKMAELSTHQTYKGSKEEIGRMMRRFFLELVCKEHNADVIALAHHEQDQQETFFIRLVRGATLTGLTAMRPKTGLYIRPLLETSKKDILDYLNTHTIAYVTDPSNESPLFLRNRIRAHVIPALKACDDRFDINFARTLARLQETEDFLEKLTQNTYATIVKEHNGDQWIDSALLKKQHPVLQERIILHWFYKEKVPFQISHNFLKEVLRFLDSPRGGKHHIHTQWYIIKQKGFARVHKLL